MLHASSPGQTEKYSHPLDRRQDRDFSSISHLGSILGYLWSGCTYMMIRSHSSVTTVPFQRGGMVVQPANYIAELRNKAVYRGCYARPNRLKNVHNNKMLITSVINFLHYPQLLKTQKRSPRQNQLSIRWRSIGQLLANFSKAFTTGQARTLLFFCFARVSARRRCAQN